MSKVGVAIPAGHVRKLIDIGLGDHRRHGCIDITCLELMQNMHVPQRRQIVMRTQSRLQGRHRALMSDVGRGPIIMVSILPRERMVASRVGVEADIRRSEEHTSELPSLMSISYAVFC